ncbi:hypothetical protein TVAG_049180 [Trichomonas vaginalis G3]|uniref:Uncharacterized protein n=1 Tax=Trichomonas vaginalis (strain ATCC PRA-98 / G3) TaxID=412133 RepID=A2FJR7_TRIV3|nr:hypothetical protein TVAGG3_0929230 [Trichomonas vaginalis G3]EAX94849.1 hypothetical protein TVAG_049180 [Trichomonas vaginalis G3]KAI5485708.1 hypothetical protein TVAGG3_0929230 [Trichomonas vaginalis G3]|eukprot:XP_001307779.1 hypothetical protein [Trichomonas vaginalis G3]
MFHRRKLDDEESLLGPRPLRPDIRTGDIPKSQVQRPKIPWPAIKSIVVAIILILIGISCATMFLLSFGPFYAQFSSNRIVLFIISFLTINAGTWTLRIAYKCYYMIDNYRWPMLFL